MLEVGGDGIDAVEFCPQLADQVTRVFAFADVPGRNDLAVGCDREDFAELGWHLPSLRAGRQQRLRVVCRDEAWTRTKSKRGLHHMFRNRHSPELCDEYLTATA